MSVDLYVLCATDVPSRSAWHAALTEQHVPLIMSERFDPVKETGFWPAKLSGKDTGFEYYLLLRSEWENLPNLNQPSRFKSGFQLSTGASVSEFVASIFASVALARSCNGVVYEPQDGKTYEGDTMNQLLDQVKLAEQMEKLTPPKNRK